jgi:hypothetical protein
MQDSTDHDPDAPPPGRRYTPVLFAPRPPAIPVPPRTAHISTQHAPCRPRLTPPNCQGRAIDVSFPFPPRPRTRQHLPHYQETTQGCVRSRCAILLPSLPDHTISLHSFSGVTAPGYRERLHTAFHHVYSVLVHALGVGSRTSLSVPVLSSVVLYLPSPCSLS